MRGFPRRYVVFDTETVKHRATRKGWDQEQSLRMGIAKVYDPCVMPEGRAVYSRFDTPGQFQEIIDGLPCEKEPIYLFAHNVGFDLRIVDWFRYVSAGRYSILPPEHMPGKGRYQRPMFIFDGSPVMMRFFRDDCQQIQVWDSFNWFPWALRRIGEMLKCPKLPMPRDEDPDEAWDAYCKADVDLCDRALRHLWGWLQCLAVSDWQPTPAAQAAQIYRMRYGKGRIKRPQDRACTSLDRMAYYGGVVEPFRLGRCDRQTYQVDCNGLYPHVMKHNIYPCEVIDHGDPGSGDRLRDQDHARECTAEVWIDSPHQPWPLRTLDGTLWVRGRVHTVLCGPELAAAVSSGCVHRIGRWVRYRCEDLFGKYVDTFWRLRRSAEDRGDQLIAKTCKHLLNSLHGKFGQKDGEWHHCGRTETPGFYGSGKKIGRHITHDIEARVLDGHMFTRVRAEEHHQAFVPIAAWTASYARIYMDEVIHMLGADNVLYQSCDSLIVTQDAFDRLHDAEMINDGELGHFKLEDSYQWIDIQGPNQIDHCHGYKHSGVKAGSVATADGVYEVEEWEQPAASIYSGNVSSVFTRRTLVRPSKGFSRRHVNADGSTTAWAVDNWSASLDDTSHSTLQDWLTARE